MKKLFIASNNGHKIEEIADILKFEDANRVGSYNYTDLFTRSVEVSMYNGENYEPLVQPQLEVKKTRITQEVVENS